MLHPDPEHPGQQLVDPSFLWAPDWREDEEYMVAVVTPQLMAWALRRGEPHQGTWLCMRRDLLRGVVPTTHPFTVALQDGLAPQILDAMDAAETAYPEEPWRLPCTALEALCWAALHGPVDQDDARALGRAAGEVEGMGIPANDRGTVLYYRFLALGAADELTPARIQLLLTAQHPGARTWALQQVPKVVPSATPEPDRSRRR